MIKCEVIESFALVERYKEVKNVVRKGNGAEPKLNKGDVFECKKDLANYLLKDNAYKKPFIRIIEVIPE